MKKADNPLVAAEPTIDDPTLAAVDGEQGKHPDPKANVQGIVHNVIRRP